MAKPKGKKKSSDKSTTLTKLLIIQAILQLIKSAIELIDKLLDQAGGGNPPPVYKITHKKPFVKCMISIILDVICIALLVVAITIGARKD